MVGSGRGDLAGFALAQHARGHGSPFAIGAVVAWDVVLVDGAAEGWPGEVLVETDVVIE
jgi:hypothetical protein